ncbi:hypothetical protein SAMN04487948_1019 [Halogranum amylolyticum]|uniref:Uncharacterized protein n=1 Tax=Halogranum amylolyticum TaxID=660520 RepID=A0A1H8MPL4_9EURY|nr:hypothetical protein SAMN04487948_1019 [Halogranum amylolyticum]
MKKLPIVRTLGPVHVCMDSNLLKPQSEYHMRQFSYTRTQEKSKK